MSHTYVLHRRTTIAAAPDEVFRFFSAPQNLGRITPKKMGFRITSAPDRPLQVGDTIDYDIRVFGLRLHWRTRIETWIENVEFSDTQERGPYRRWHHTHSFRAVDGGVELTDLVEYELPLGFLGRLVAGDLVKKEVLGIFDYRQQVIEELFPPRL